MPRAARVPSYRRHKGRNLAVVVIRGKSHYLGKWNSPESKAEYARIIREWAAAQGAGPAPKPARTGQPAPGDPTVSEVLAAYFRHAERHYRDRDGNPTLELQNVKDAVRPLRALYGPTLASEFGPLGLQAVRNEMIASGLARTTVNQRVNRVRRVFTWAASVQLIPGSVPADLRTVAGLQEGRSEAPEPEGIGPVPMERVEAVLPLLPPPVAAMVLIQLLSACRAGEVMRMTTRALTPGSPTWTYRPARHKTAWRGKGRSIALGPKAVEVLRPFLRPDEPDRFLFSPAESAETMRARRAAARKTKRTPSELAKTRKAAPERAPADHYDRRSYRQAIVRACDRAFPHPTLSAIEPAELTGEQRAELAAWRAAHRWSPLQLRHTAATEIRSRHGLEAAANVLGHAKPDTTLIYAERDEARARDVMAAMG